MYLFDAHCDFLWSVTSKKKTLLTKEFCRNNKIKKSVFALFEDDGKRETIKKQYERYFQKKPIKHTYLSFEGLSWVENEKDEEFIKQAAPLMVAPVWNKKNALGGSCKDDSPISEKGKRVLDKISQYACIDLAHSGEKMFFSCCDRYQFVTFSHGNVRALCDNARNITDAQIKTLIDKRGFFGLSLYSAFAGGRSAATFVDHVEHVLDLGGENILGFGTDIDGCDELVCHGERFFEKIAEEMAKRNISAKLRDKIFFKNAETCFENFM